MEFKQYIDKAWNDHATDTQSVFNNLGEGEKLIVSNENIPVLASLITHICGDHLGLWEIGVEKLQNLKLNSQYIENTDSELAINRSIAILQFCSGELKDINHFSISDQTRILAQAAGMISERGDISRAKEYFNNSLEIASRGLEKEDPANRALAITGNNLACTLEEKINRSELETELMIIAALAARKFWEIAGGPSEVASAEYRLSQSYLQALQIEKSFEHAQLSVEACELNKSSPLDYFFGYEAIALVEKARKNDIGYSKAIEKMKHHFELLSEDDKKWCEKTLNNFL
jgi:hypothetical protein